MEGSCGQLDLGCFQLQVSAVGQSAPVSSPPLSLWHLPWVGLAQNPLLHEACPEEAAAREHLHTSYKL